MKRFLLLPMMFVMALPWLTACQEDYITEIEDRPTDRIDFSSIMVSRDTACMFDTIVLTAVAKGENLKYTWQRAKGSLAPVKNQPNKVYFWGCQTCCGDLTIKCTVENEYGAYTREARVFIYPWYSWEEPWTEEKFNKWMDYINSKK